MNDPQLENLISQLKILSNGIKDINQIFEDLNEKLDD